MAQTLPGLTDAQVQVNGQTISCSSGGSGPALLLLHGFPQTRAMWHGIVPALTGDFTVVAADLRGYGDSSKPEGVANYSFREMAADQVALMRELGHDRFHVVGHDRGARTAHRMALDSPQAVASLTLMDIIPTLHLLETLTPQVARAYYHWFFLSQPAPLPETIIAHDPDHYFESLLAGLDPAGLDAFDPEALFAYRQAWRWPDTIAAMCNDYRAAIATDMLHDGIDRGRRVDCPALVLFGSDGIMARHYDVAATWADRLADMRAIPMPGGHFFPELFPTETASALLGFLRGIQTSP